MIDLSMQYMGLKLSGPIMVSSTPLSESVENVLKMQEAGASAVVLTSLFEEQLQLESGTLDDDLWRGTESYAEALDYLPDLEDYRMSNEGYLDHLRRVKRAVSIPVFASLNGVTAGGWIRFAKQMEDAGADALELNTFAIATTPAQTSNELELQLLELVENICREVKIPVAVKLSSTFTSLPHLVARLHQTGAKGVVLFNRFYQPDFDVEQVEVKPTLHFSTPSELLQRLHAAAILFGQVDIDIALTGGVHSAEDVVKCVMAGANVSMMASALHIHGIGHIERVLADLQYWLERHEYTSLAEMRGCLSRRSAPDKSPFDRGNYIKTLSSYSLRQTTAAF